MKRATEYFLAPAPGMLLAIGVAAPAVQLHRVYPPLSAVAIAMGLGLIIRNTIGVPDSCREGTGFAVQRLLRLAIILLGARLSFMEVAKIAGTPLLVVLTCITAAIVLVRGLSRLFHLSPRLGTLIAVGTAICGNSAIAATAPVIQARDEETTFAISVITLFGLLAVVVYPLIGHLLGMSHAGFGSWAGTAINDTSQVVTAGFIYSESAGKVATVVKLTRNLFLAPVIVILGILHNRKHPAVNPAATGGFLRAIPLFVLGFLAMAVLRTLGVFPATLIAALKEISDFLIVVSIAAVGLGTSFQVIRAVGWKPFYAGLAASVLMGAVSYGLIRLCGIG